MIRRGKAEGWLELKTQDLDDWAALNGVRFNNVRISAIFGSASKGAGLVASSNQLHENATPLIQVPKDLLLSLENVLLHAKVDQHLREVIERMGEYSRTPRGAILIFLLMTTTSLCPNVDKKIGVSNPFTEYVKSLPLEYLPTLWSEDELELLEGTSLAAATRAKNRALDREFTNLQKATRDIPWCKKYWWDETEGLISLDDWKQVDAMYRSRALEFPGIGDCMGMLEINAVLAPCIDTANHAAGDQAVGLYEADEEKNGLLLLRDGKRPEVGEEVTISYGDEKGACEMIFSYGFLEDGQDSANDVFLGLEIPPDDPLKGPKNAFAESAPGVRLTRGAERSRWTSDYVWIICVNEEDGLKFKVVATIDGEGSLKAFWKDEEIQDISKLKLKLQADPMWDLFQLRAAAIIQVRVEEQLDALKESEELLSQKRASSGNMREATRELAHRLRVLEQAFLGKAHEDLESEKMALLKSKSVRAYLESVSGMSLDDDFS